MLIQKKVLSLLHINQYNFKMLNLTSKEYKNLVNEFSFDTDIKPEIYRILKYEHYIEQSGMNDNEISDLVFEIQDKVYEMYKNK